MQEADEQDTCRICSAPAEPDQPLFHPCKCSGTIRYIHQDCLTTWLAHSKKKNCDVCKHAYSFTKVYATDMPSSLPPILLVRRLLQHAFMGILFVIRAIAVATIWLGVLPWVTVWTWRMYFSMGETAAWWISNRPKPSIDDTAFHEGKVHYEPAVPPPQTLVGKITTHPLWLALSADIFTGQIIASLIVLTFIAVFLLREWISQNARPGVFEEEEALPVDVPPAAQPAPPMQQPGRVGPMRPEEFQAHMLEHPPPGQHDGFPEPNRLLQRQIDTMRAIDVMQRQNIVPEVAMDPSRWYAEENENIMNRRGKKRKKARSGNASDSDSDRGKGKHSTASRFDVDAVKRAKFRRQLTLAKTMAARKETNGGFMVPGGYAPSASSSPSLPVDDDFAFPTTFPSFNSSSAISPSTNNTAGPSSSSSSPISDIPFSLRTWPTPSANSSTHSLGSHPSRPPLPTTVETDDPRGPPPPIYSLSTIPINSPNLATYRAPEELGSEAGPSNFGYFPPGRPQIKDGQFVDVDREDSADDDDEVHNPFRVRFQAANADSDVDVDMEAEARRFFRDRGMPKAETYTIGNPEVPFADTDSDNESGEEDHVHIEGHFEDEHDDDHEEEHFRDAEEEEEEEDDPEIGEGLFDDDGQWEEVEVPPAARAPAPAPGVNQDADIAAGLEAGDELDVNVEDEMDGAMEAIGLRGPVFGVFQNAALMIFVLDTAIGIGVWVPFTIGKTAALLSLDPRRLLQVLHLPIRAMRLVTDPIVDLVAFLIVDLSIPWIAKIFKGLFWLFVFLARNSYSEFLWDNSWVSRILETSSKVYDASINLLKPITEISWSSTSEASEEAISNSTLASDFVSSIPDYLGFTEPYFEILGKEVRISATNAQTTWIQLALGSGPTNRVFAVSLGYIVVSFFLCLYLNILTVGNARTAGLAVRNAVRQQLLVLKVATFIFIELVTFPLGCGIVLDLCTVWLFPEANMQSRIAFFVQAPLTAMFYHWVAGTMFMYSFAVLLSGCRSVMRPGAMWFIKDPQDQNSHPIRDILDRPTFVQLRKICVSGLMYSFVVACVVGSVAGLLILGSKSIMPFRWKNREPLSEVPVDLLFLHLVLPYTMHYFRPKRTIKNVATTVWKFLATRLRLTSYFFGGRYLEEEYTPKNWKDNFVRSDVHVFGVDDIPDGSFRRVPATDNLALPRDMRATVAVTAEGEPLDQEGKELMATQNAEAEKAKRLVKDDYLVVYMPPHFRYRIIGFIALLWTFGAMLLGVTVAVPILLGRSFFRFFSPRDVHDGYSFILGVYMVWMCYLVAQAIDRLDKRRQRRSGDGPRANLHVLVLKRGLLWIAKTLYMVFWLGVVIPVLLAVVIDLYMILPIRLTLDPAMEPRIRVVDMWALGLLYVKIGLHVHRVQPPNRITRGLQHVLAHGWTRPDPVMATKEFIAPLAGGLLGMIILPGAIFRTIQHFFPEMPVDNRFIFMHVYPSVFIVAGFVRTIITLYGLLRSWSQAIRDKEFLVEMRLKNHEPEALEVTDETAIVDADEQNVMDVQEERGIEVAEAENVAGGDDNNPH